MVGPDQLEAARTTYHRSAWTEAYDALSALDLAGGLGAENLYGA